MPWIVSVTVSSVGGAALEVAAKTSRLASARAVPNHIPFVFIGINLGLNFSAPVSDRVRLLLSLLVSILAGLPNLS
jgi:hypothetical protein